MAVGEVFLSAFLGVLFDRLASQKAIDLFKGTKLDINLLNKLKRKMQSVAAVLDDAEEKQVTRPLVRKWLDDLKDAFYEAEDLLDEMAYAAVSSEMEAEPQKSIVRFWKFISSEDPLKEIHDKLQDLLDQTNELDLKVVTGVKLSSQRVPTTSLMDESVVYGRDEDKEVIIQLLLSNDANCSKLGLIPIVGMGGVGKTTLAQSVYNDSRVEKRFRLKSWIWVSAEFNVSEITKNILNDVSEEPKPDFNTLITLDNFQVALKKKLSDEKFLLVLDNVWNDCSNDWDSLLRPLKAGAQGSKIIITTRLESVPSVLKVQPHHLEKLSDEQCWSLFSTHAFPGGSSGASTILEEIGKKIARKCDGLPLAAKSLGRLLYNVANPQEWRGVLNSDIWNLKKDDIIPALRLSYYYLPCHLKQCFAYCAIFPKGYCFEKEELVLLWMGEGFLGQASIERSREDIGKKYFDDLVSRSFFNPKGNVFIMHDLINDLARSVAGKFSFRLDDSNEVPPRTRHLRYVRTTNLWSDISKVIAASAPLLRTFLLVDDGRECQVIYDTQALMKFERLRVLSLSLSLGWYPRKLKLDDSISNLKHLRYLNLSRISSEFLPESLCCLYLLEILLLRSCFDLVELPSNLENLANLCVLDITRTKLQKMPPHMGKLKKLEKLSYFVIGEKSKSSIQELGNLQERESRIQELGNLQQLRGRLVIRNLQNVKYTKEASRANLELKEYLEELELVWNWEGDDDDDDYDPPVDDDDPEHAISLLEQLKPHENVQTLTISGYGGIEFPNWIGGGSLVTLKLDGCRHCCRLPPLGQLLHLKELCIRDFPNILLIGTEFYGRCTKPFQCLEVLRFENMPLWEEWETCGNEKKVFPLLKELHIIGCPAFKRSLPQYLPSLIKLEFRGNERLVASLPKIPKILNMYLKGLYLSDGRLKLNDSPLERMELLGGCGFFNTLQEVQICSCHFLKCFPLESFSDLKDLHIDHCSNFERIIGNSKSLISLEIVVCQNFVSFPGVGLKTPNLQRLELRYCSNLKWMPESLPYSLEELIIFYCPKLESFPEGGLPSKLHRLEIDGCTKLVNGLNRWNLYRLPSLLYFRICDYKHVECFPEEPLLPPTLTSLTIQRFPNLKSLEYKGIQHLTSLQSLTVQDCPELRLLPEESLPSSLTFLRVSTLNNLESLVNSNIQQLRNLKKLSIIDCPKLKFVPEEGLPSTITSLEISSLPDLESLNFKGLQNLTSLEKLTIKQCLKLRSLPKEGLPSSLSSLSIIACPLLKEGLPSSLSSLCILWCPLLKERCEREKGEDWPKISHISNIHIC